MRALSDGIPLRFDAGGAIAKWHRLRRKISHLERLRGEWGPYPLDAKLTILHAHHQALLARHASWDMGSPGRPRAGL